MVWVGCQRSQKPKRLGFKAKVDRRTRSRQRPFTRSAVFSRKWLVGAPQLEAKSHILAHDQLQLWHKVLQAPCFQSSSTAAVCRGVLNGAKDGHRPVRVTPALVLLEFLFSPRLIDVFNSSFVTRHPFHHGFTRG